MAIDIDQSHYLTGTATVAGTTVTGQGTAWLGAVRPGDLFGTHKGSGVRIQSVNSNTSLTLAYAVTGLNQTAAVYEIQRTPYDVGYLAAIEDMIRLYGVGNLPSLAGLNGTGGDKGVMLTGAGTAGTFPLKPAARAMLALDGVANKIPYLTGASTAALADLSPFMRGLLSATSQPALRLTVTPGERGVFTPPDFATADLTPSGVLALIGGPGLYSFASSVGTEVVLPPGFPLVAGVISGGSSNSGGWSYSWQVLVGNNGQTWSRRGTGASTWSAWVLSYHAGNIIGTVSQSGGVPTGAIIERGSNANGQFVRFADGTQICSQTNGTASLTTSSFGSGFISSIVTFTFPVAFIDIPSAAPASRWVTGDSPSIGLAFNQAVTTTTVSAYAFSGVNTGGTRLGYTAIGRWF